MIEILVGGALIALVAVGGLSAYSQLSRIEQSNTVTSTADDRVSEIIENIRQQPTTQIIQYSMDPLSILAPEKLKMGWSIQTEAPAEECKDCPGRYGYVITPLSEALGDLYLVTVYFTYKDWPEPRKYEFVVSR